MHLMDDDAVSFFIEILLSNISTDTRVLSA